jgi:alpha-D-ribose 1-methylphosphonate 5-triphosphate synthase subunit PhnL
MVRGVDADRGRYVGELADGDAPALAVLHHIGIVAEFGIEQAPAFRHLGVSAEPAILEIRRETIGYVSQFLRVVPRVGTLDIVAEPLVERGVDRRKAIKRAGELLSRLNLPERLWALPPTTFSGGEQQRVNIARGFITDHPVLLLDEPTASLDAVNRTVVVDMITEKKRAGAAVLGIFHDAEIRKVVADVIIDVTSFAPSAKAA